MEDRNIQGFILAIILVGTALVVGIFIAATIQTNFRAFNTAGSAVNESIAKPTPAGITLASASLTDGSCGSVTAILNGTGGVPIGLGNITQTGCTVVNATATTTFASTWLISYPYTYSADTASSNASGNLSTALSGGTAWITILVVVGFAVIVLGLLSEGLGRAAGSQVPGSPVY